MCAQVSASSCSQVKNRVRGMQRVVLLSRNPETGRISFRHYSIVAKPSGVSKGVKSIVGRRVPDLSRLHDVSELLTQGGYGSVSSNPLADADRLTDLLASACMLARLSACRAHAEGHLAEMECLVSWH